MLAVAQGDHPLAIDPQVKRHIVDIAAEFRLAVFGNPADPTQNDQQPVADRLDPRPGLLGQQGLAHHRINPALGADPVLSLGGIAFQMDPQNPVSRLPAANLRPVPGDGATPAIQHAGKAQTGFQPVFGQAHIIHGEFSRTGSKKKGLPARHRYGVLR